MHVRQNIWTLKCGFFLTFAIYDIPMRKWHNQLKSLLNGTRIYSSNTVNTMAFTKSKCTKGLYGYGSFQKVCTRLRTLCGLRWFWYKAMCPYFWGSYPGIEAIVPAKRWIIWVNNSHEFKEKWYHNHNKHKHNKSICIFCGMYCTSHSMSLYG